MTSTQINQGNYTAYQPYMLLNFDYSFQNDVLDDDLSVTILEVLGRINLNKFIDFHNLDSRSYDPVMMLTIILMAFAEDGYAYENWKNFVAMIFVTVVSRTVVFQVIRALNDSSIIH